MSLYTIADTHLSLASRKPMDKFGARWTSHTEKIRSRWAALIEDKDTVVIPGDISWAMTLNEAKDDLLFIDSLPGHKIISKGNHDYMWTTASKMKAFLSSIGAETIEIMHNNAFYSDGFVICGTRGWYIEPKLQKAELGADYEKLVSRECTRLSLSLEYGKKLLADRGEDGFSDKVRVFLHFPPVFGDFLCRPLVDVLRSYGVKKCYFGHIHSTYNIPAETEFERISFELISADYLDFYPRKVF